MTANWDAVLAIVIIIILWRMFGEAVSFLIAQAWPI